MFSSQPSSRAQRLLHLQARTCLLAGALLALVALPHGQVWAQALSRDQQNCVNHINKNFAKVAKAQARVISTCISAGSKGQLEDQTIEACMTADKIGKVDKAEQKTLEKERSKCQRSI